MADRMAVGAGIDVVRLDLLVEIDGARLVEGLGLEHEAEPAKAAEHLEGRADGEQGRTAPALAQHIADAADIALGARLGPAFARGQGCGGQNRFGQQFLAQIIGGLDHPDAVDARRGRLGRGRQAKNSHGQNRRPPYRLQANPSHHHARLPPDRDPTVRQTALCCTCEKRRGFSNGIV